MQYIDILAAPGYLINAEDTWNQARSLTQLQEFISSKFDSNDEEISDLF